MKRHHFLQRWLPHPFIGVACGTIWLMLAQGIDASDLLTAFLLGLVVPHLVDPFIAKAPKINWFIAIKLFFVVLWDIIVSNFVVAKLVLGPKRNLAPKWFRVPLATSNEQVNALLAMIISTTPGTVSAGIDQERGDILVHALNTHNTDTDVQNIKSRYETKLIQIFGVSQEEIL